jgi:cell division protein ZapA
MADPRVVHVEVNGQRYPIRSALDPSYVQELAIYVDRKMRVAFDSAPSTDALGLAILAALNIADEYFRARQQSSSASGDLNERAMRLERMVDDVLAQVTVRKAVAAP